MALGLFDEVVPDDRVFPRALEVAAELAALPPVTYSLVKRRLRGGTRETPTAASAMAEAAEAARRVLEGRPPNSA